MRRSTFMAISIALGMLTTPVYAEIYGYHPQTTLKIGGGFDPQRPLNNALVCLDGAVQPIENTAVSASFNANVIHSREELLKVLHIDASLSGRYGLYSGGASFQYDSEYSFDEDSLTWAVYADEDFGRLQVVDPHPNAYAKGLILKHAWTQFVSGCGTEVVTAERRRGSVAAIFSVHNLSTSEKESLEAKANFGASGGVWSVGAQASYRSFVSQASEISTIRVSVAVVGGQGVQVLAGLATDYDDLQKVSDIVKGYISGINFGNAAPAEYDTTDWAAFGYAGSITGVTRQSAILASLYVKYQDTQRARERAHALLDQAAQPIYQGRLTPEQTKTLQAEQDSSDRTIDLILTRADSCKRAISTCKTTTDISVPSIPWPSLAPIDHYQVLSYGLTGCSPSGGQVTGGCYTDAKIDVTYDTNVVQSFDFYANDAIHLGQTQSSDEKLSASRKALKGSWKSEILETHILGAHRSAFMVVKDKADIDTIYSITLSPQ